jgi:hypothetical protein
MGTNYEADLSRLRHARTLSLADPRTQFPGFGNRFPKRRRKGKLVTGGDIDHPDALFSDPGFSQQAVGVPHPHPGALISFQKLAVTFRAADDQCHGSSRFDGFEQIEHIRASGTGQAGNPEVSLIFRNDFSRIFFEKHRCVGATKNVNPWFHGYSFPLYVKKLNTPVSPKKGMVPGETGIGSLNPLSWSRAERKRARQNRSSTFESFRQ